MHLHEPDGVTIFGCSQKSMMEHIFEEFEVGCRLMEDISAAILLPPRLQSN